MKAKQKPAMPHPDSPDPRDTLAGMLETSKRPVLMGVINVTPDSFSDGGHFNGVEPAVAHAQRLLDEGAKIIDIGGESTRPGANPVPVKEEQARVLPVIAALKDMVATKDALISIDTRNAATMEAAVNEGAGLINDVTALGGDEESLSVAAALNVPVCLMHMQGAPQTMQDNPSYDDVVQDIISFFRDRITACEKAGIDPARLVLDPGIGFGKTLDHNMAILNNVQRFGDLGLPVLIGASRKSFIAKICGNVEADKRLPGSLAAALEAARQGADILRVHDVAETRQALMVQEAILNG